MAEEKSLKSLNGVLLFLNSRKYFFVFLGFYILYCLLTFRSFGLVTDEMSCYNGGAVYLKYFKGVSKEALTADDYVTHNYVFTALLLKLALAQGVPLDRLHLLNLLFASLLFWAIYEFLNAAVKDARWALLGPAALFLTPRFLGDIAQNPKDVPFAEFYFLSLCAVYFRRPLFPGRSLRIMGLGLTFGFAISNRVIGLPLFVIYALYRFWEGWADREWAKGRLGQWLLGETLEQGAIFIVSQLTLAVLWPYIGADYFHHFIGTVLGSKKYDWGGSVLFGGEIIPAKSSPWDYLLVWIGVTTPLFLLAFILFALARSRALLRNKAYVLMLLAVLVNLVLCFLLKPTIFNGLRHYLFLLPILVTIACLGLNDFFAFARNGALRWLTGGFAGLNALAVAFHLFSLFPYDYLYFNELVGGVRGANGLFEMDYWSKSTKEAAEWLRTNEFKDPSKKYRIKLTDGAQLAAYFLPPNAQGSLDLTDGVADYCLAVNRSSPFTLPSGWKVAHVVGREGVPLTWVLEPDPDKSVPQIQ